MDQPLQIIDLTGDDDADTPPTVEDEPEDHFPYADAADFDDFAGIDEMEGILQPPPAQDHELDRPRCNIPPEAVAGMGGQFVRVDGEMIFIPDEDDDQGSQGHHQAGAGGAQLPHDYAAYPHAEAGPAGDQDGHVQPPQNAAGTQMSPDDCLQLVLSVFPDVSHNHVLDLWNKFDTAGEYESLPGPARFDNIIEQLLSNPSYPKQQKGKNSLKRKRTESDVEDLTKKWAAPDRPAPPTNHRCPTLVILKSQFMDIPTAFIKTTLATEKHLYGAFMALAKLKDESDETNRPYGKGRPSKSAGVPDETLAANCPELLEELNAARLSLQKVREAKAVDNEKRRLERENLERAIAAGETAECTVCFDDLPMNRQIHCNGAVAHFICFECMVNYIKSEIGQARCRVLCTAGCGSGFASNQLNLLDDKDMVEKLAQLQQEQDIREAALEDLEECPFCDYKAILPPIEADFEFRCANPDCEKVSCRRCKSISHIPISCEQYAKDNKINSRHKIEEAMTAALVRSCNKCKKQFIKSDGCNKMACQSCGNLQCYVCSETIKDYNHFDQHPNRTANNIGGSSKTKCPLYDNVEERHEREVKEAEAAARAQLLEENPDVTEEDLEIKVSDAVKQSTADRVRRAGGGVYGAGGGLPAGYNIAPPPIFPVHRNLDQLRELAGRGLGDAPGANAQPGGVDAQVVARRVALQRHREEVRNRVAALGGNQRQRRVHPQEMITEMWERAAQRPVRPIQPAQPQHLQGYIPVFGFNPGLPPAAGQQQAAPVFGAQGPDVGEQQAQHMDDIFDLFGFNGGQQVQPHIPAPGPLLAQLVNPLPVIDNNNNGGANAAVGHYGPFDWNAPFQPLPGAWPAAFANNNNNNFNQPQQPPAQNRNQHQHQPIFEAHQAHLQAQFTGREGHRGRLSEQDQRRIVEADQRVPRNSVLMGRMLEGDQRGGWQG